MKKIFAPWRIRYIEAPKYEGCIFCDFPKENRDEERLIVYRGKRCFVILNNYPYNPGHVMVAPYRHFKEIEEMSEEEGAEMLELTKKAVKVIKKVMKPDGFNIGINIGKVAGAGIEQHLHIHIVPRWEGDTSFIPVLADVKIIPEAVAETYKKLKRGFEELEE